MAKKEEEYVFAFKHIDEEAKKRAKKVIKEINEIPYICYQFKDGTFGSLGEIDPNYKMDIPNGAIKGDLSKQVPFCMHCNVPKFYYEDISFKCACCGKGTVFKAEEQKKWREELKFHPKSFPKECPECRKKIRSGEILKGAGRYIKREATKKYIHNTKKPK